MALSNPNMAYRGQGPSQSGQILATKPSSEEFAYVGVFEATGGDGSDAAFDVGYIDGTKTLSFTPSAIFLSRIPATNAANEAAAGIVASVTAITNAKFTVTLSAAPASGKDIKFAALIVK